MWSHEKCGSGKVLNPQPSKVTLKTKPAASLRCSWECSLLHEVSAAAALNTRSCHAPQVTPTSQHTSDCCYLPLGSDLDYCRLYIVVFLLYIRSVLLLWKLNSLITENEDFQDFLRLFPRIYQIVYPWLYCAQMSDFFQCYWSYWYFGSKYIIKWLLMELGQIFLNISEMAQELLLPVCITYFWELTF